MSENLNSSYVAGQRRRIAQFFVILLVVVGILVGRMAWWQLWPHPEYQPYDPGHQDPWETTPAVRGTIMDANGHPLVISTYSYDLWVLPMKVDITQREGLGRLLSEVLGLPYGNVMDTLHSNVARRQFLRGRVSTEDWQVLEERAQGDPETDKDDIDLGALERVGGFLRICPDGELAGVVIGFVNLEGESSYGIEHYYDKALRGQEGRLLCLRGPNREELMALSQGYRPPLDGANLVLTLDRNVQYEAERILRQAVRAHEAESGGLVVMEAKTGAIVAMADYPTYRPDRYWEVEDATHRNDVVTSAYEPGSVVKSLTLAAALDAGVIEPTDTYVDEGGIEMGGRYLQNADKRAHGTTTMTELLAKSLNVGAVHVAKELGAPRFYEAFRNFGFGEVTGVDLAGEQGGKLRVPDDGEWTQSDLGTNSYGQGISTTPIQVVAAYGALANGGVRMRPYVVAEQRYITTTERYVPHPVMQVVSEETAEEITEMLADAVEMEMHAAMVPGYRVAGKSGTANIRDDQGGQGYSEEEVVPSFIGYGPLPDPRYVVLVKLHRTPTGNTGLAAAAPAFAEMCEYLFDYYGIQPTESATVKVE